MTARKAGELAAEGVWVTLRRLRDQWVLLVFAASVLFWARDVYDRFVDLPDRVARLEAGHAVGDGWPGDAVTVGIAPVEGARCVCRDGDPAALVVDAAGMWCRVVGADRGGAEARVRGEAPSKDGAGAR